MTENIHTAIIKVMQEVGYVQKAGKVSGYGANYTYAGEADLIQALRPEMVKNDILMHVKHIEGIQREQYETKKGTLMNSTIITGVMEFVHAPSGTAVEAWAIGEGTDSGDKSANKAMTGMYKYALRQTFCIETGDDPDSQPSGEQERGKAIPSSNRKATTTSKAPAAKHAMDYETAATVTNSDGELYINLDSEKLSYMSGGIDKALKNNTTPERRDELEFKRDAIKVILAKRAEVAA